MTFNEYYGFPEGTNATHRYLLSSWYDFPTAQLPANCGSLFSNDKAPYACPWDTSNVTDTNEMFLENNSLVDISALASWDMSNVVNINYMFSYCNQLTDVSPIYNWNTSKVTDMSYLFNYCSALKEVNLSNWDTSKVQRMDAMFVGCSALESIGPIDCSSAGKNYYPIHTYSNLDKLTHIGGFLNMKSSWDENYGLAKCPNLTYESCINVLDGLYDFTGHGETPNSNQGKLKVHQNFLDLVGDEITIGTNKNWTITT